MAVDAAAKEKKLARANAISVLKKILTGSVIIMLVGICAYASLIILMKLI